MMQEPETWPVKPGDWVVSDGDEIAMVKSVHWDNEVLVDLYIYSRDGNKVGRTSPIEGGPRTFEPACAYRFWRRIEAPRFPIAMVWIDNGNGRRSAGYDFGPTLPPREWKRPKRRRFLAPPPKDAMVEALKAIAAGHNDPRALARKVLGK